MLYIYGALITGLLMDICIKYVSSTVSTWQLVGLRWAFAAVLLLPFALQSFTAQEWRQFGKIHIIRTLLNLIGTFCLFYALHKLPLSAVMAIFFMEPVFATLFSALFGREIVNPVQWAICCFGFISVFLIVYGTQNHHADFYQAFNYDGLIALSGAAAWALMSVMTKRYGHNHSALSLVFWLSVSTSITSIFISAKPLYDAQLHDMGLIFLAAIFGSLYSIFWITGLKKIAISTASSLMYLNLPLSFLAGFILFGEQPGRAVMMGSAMIFIIIPIISKPAMQKKLADIFVKKC